jgi:hypothetical protein
MRSKRLEAGWNNDYLLKILNLKVGFCPALCKGKVGFLILGFLFS